MEWLSMTGTAWDIIRPVADILIIAYILYRVYLLIAQTRAVELVRVLIFMGSLYAAAYFLQLRTLLWLYRHATPIIIVVLAIIYQPELRRAFTRIGMRSSRFFGMGSKTSAEQIDVVLGAMQDLSNKGRGALVVFPRKIPTRGVIDSGTRINAEISGSLLRSMFGHDTPLHDGAVIIQDGRITTAGCFLPISEQADIRKSFGSRHRAALGMAEETDAVVLVVSEETGSMSLAYNANLYYELSLDAIRRSLIALLNYQDINQEDAEEVLDEAE